MKIILLENDYWVIVYVLPLVAVVQDQQMNELLIVLDTLGSIMNRDPILNSYDIIETDSDGHINHDVISRYVIINIYMVIINM